MDSDRFHRQPVDLAHDGQETCRNLSPPRRRVKLPEGERPLLPGEVSLQPRAQRTLLEAENVVDGVRNQTLCRTGNQSVCLFVF